MDFDLAAKRLERDQTKLRGSRRAGRNVPPALSEQAQREAARRKRQQQQLAEQRAQQQRHREAMETYFRQCERASILYIDCVFMCWKSDALLGVQCSLTS